MESTEISTEILKAHYMLQKRDKIKDTTCYQVVSVEKMVEPRGVEPLSESTFTVTSPGAVCLLEFPPRRAGKQARRFGRVMLHDGGNSYPVHVHH